MSLAFELPGIPFGCHAHDVVLDRDIVRRQIVQRRSARRSTVVELEAGVMPWAAERLADENAFVERSPVMGALPADGKPVRLDVRENDWLSKGVTAYELTRHDAADLDSLGEIGSGQLIGLFGHFSWSDRFCARSRCAGKAGATFVTAQRVGEKMRISRGLFNVANTLTIENRPGLVKFSLDLFDGRP